MVEPVVPEPGADERARRAADRLALALEDIGVDVGRAFPLLSSVVDRVGTPVVELGRVRASVAEQLAAVLSKAAAYGIGVPGHHD